MPLKPREWIVWTCVECKAINNVSPANNHSDRQERVWCSVCGGLAENAQQRAAIDIPELGLVGSGETAGLDYLAAIANAVVDIRNKYFALNYTPNPMAPSEGSDDGS